MRAHRWGLGIVVVACSVACGSELEPGAELEPESGPTAVTDDDAPPSAVAPAPEPPPPAPPSAEEPLPAPAEEPPLPVAPFPVVFLHGMAGWVEAGAEPFALAYFRGVKQALEAVGEEVYFTQASPYASSLERAAQIAPQLDQILARTGAGKLNLVAHSQGGLDARIVVSPAGLGYGDRIASVTTVATPHRGTPVADLSLRALGPDQPSRLSPVVESAVAWLGRSVYDLDDDDASELRLQLIDLSEARAQAFNGLYVNATGVDYESYAGRTNLRAGRDACEGSVLSNDESRRDPTAPALQLTTTYIEGLNPLRPRVNDGLVPVDSARWGTFVGCVPADHLDQMGQNLGLLFDAREFYVQLVARLRQRGY